MMAVPYDPSQQFQIEVWDVKYRHDPLRTLLARIYQPQGGGPFSVLLDVHGGTWNDQDRMANPPVDERLAASGLLVVAIKEWPNDWESVPLEEVSSNIVGEGTFNRRRFACSGDDLVWITFMRVDGSYFLKMDLLSFAIRMVFLGEDGSYEGKFSRALAPG
jgi:hypothetical protein